MGRTENDLIWYLKIYLEVSCLTTQTVYPSLGNEINNLHRNKVETNFRGLTGQRVGVRASVGKRAAGAQQPTPHSQADGLTKCNVISYHSAQGIRVTNDCFLKKEAQHVIGNRKKK